MELILGGIVEPGAYEPGFGVEADLKLNDLLGGHADVSMYKRVSGSWELVSDFGPVEYNTGDEDEAGVFSFGYYDNELDALWGNDYEGRRYQAKFVVEYTYPDGKTGTLESPLFEQYGGGFAHYVNSPEIWYDAENKLLMAEIVFDLSLVEPGNVTILTGSANFEGGTNLGVPSLYNAYTAGDGTSRWVFALPLEEFTPGEYWYDLGLRYSNGLGPNWEVELFVTCYLD